MVNQQIFLPMIPDSAPIVVNISQYDYDAAGYAGRLFFNLINNGIAYDMDGATAVIQGEKPDGKAFAYPATVVNESVVRVNVRQQMTVVSGRVTCQLVLNNNDGQIGSFNIWLEVQPSGAAGGDPSQTDVPALVAQAKEYAEEAEQAAIDAQSWSAHPPYIGANGNWFVYDIATTTYVDSGVYASGTEGSLWYSGTAVSGKDPTAHVFPTGIAEAREHDMYLNTNEGAIYECTLGGPDSTAKWAFKMTLTGGGGGTSDYPDLTNKPQINGVTLVGNKTSSDLLISINGLADTVITNAQDGQLLTVVMVGGQPQFQNKAPDKSFVRYGGAKVFADLTSALLTAANEDRFFLVTDGGIIDSTNIGLWASTYSIGDVIPPDAHIAVLNVGTEATPDYRFDDFGGYIDISGKADKSEIIQWVSGRVSNANSLTLTDSRITTNTKIACILGDNGTTTPVKYSAVSVANGSITITFPEATTALIDVGISNA